MFRRKQLIRCLDSATVHGRVLNSAGELVAGATVHLQQNGASRAEAVVDATGEYTFSGLATGTYVLIAEKAGVRSRCRHTDNLFAPRSTSGGSSTRRPTTSGDKSDQGSTAPAEAMEFADNPNFAVAGVTDWTAAGGHGSDTSLRTSEALTRETLTLKPGSVGPGTTASTGRGSYRESHGRKTAHGSQQRAEGF